MNIPGDPADSASIAKGSGITLPDFKLVLETVPYPVAVLLSDESQSDESNLDTGRPIFVFCNDLFNEMIGSDSTAVGDDFWNYFDVPKDSPVSHDLKHIFSGGDMVPINRVHLTAARGASPGETFELRFIPVRNEDDKISHFIVCRDRPETGNYKHISDNERLLEFIYDNANLGVCSCTSDGTIVRMNGAFKRLVGGNEKDVIQHKIEQFILRDSNNSGRAVNLGNLCKGSEWVVRNDAGDVRIVAISGAHMNFGAPDGVTCLTFDDVTEYRQVELALMRAKDEAEVASRTKSAFLANMSHELRTPLNAIIGFSEIIKSQFMGPLGEPRYLEYVTDIHRSANHLLEIINNILDISKIEAGRLELHEESIDVGKMLDSCLSLIRERALRHGVTLEIVSEPNLPLLLADATKLRQILINLLSNAVKFTPEGGQVTVRSLITEDKCTAFEIEDTGIGMTEEELEIAMEPFGQVDSDLARRYEGTGLGLPLTKALTELHGGTLVMKSEAGVGTVARVEFPTDRSVVLPSFMT